jgi:hypothetical protein
MFVAVHLDYGRIYMPTGLRSEDREKSLVLFAKGGESKAWQVEILN